MSGFPSVSVVIPVRDGADGLRSAVESALAQDYPGELEVIIGLAGSRDGTDRIAADLATSSSVTVVPNERGGTASGLNAAIRAARGDVIVRCDAQAVLPPSYVSKAVETLRETGAACVGGMQVAVGESPLQRAIAMAVTSRLGAGDARHRVGGAPGPVDTVYLGVFRRTVLERAQGYDERFVRSQDAELNHRIRELGDQVWFDPRLRVRYRPRRSLRALWRQYFQYGWWKRILAKVHGGTLRVRQLVPPLFVLALIASLAASPAYPLAAAVVPGAYLLVVLAETLRQLLATREWAALLLPAVFPTIHLSWGSGFLMAQFRPVPEK